MKIELSEHSSRFLNVTGIPRGHPADVDKLAVYVMYRDTASVANALALDGQVIPQIVRAVNCHDELVAALEEARHLAYREYIIRANGELGKPYLGKVLAQCDAALAKAKGGAS